MQSCALHQEWRGWDLMYPIESLVSDQLIFNSNGGLPAAPESYSVTDDDDAPGWWVHGWRACVKIRQSSVCIGVEEFYFVVNIRVFNADIVVLCCLQIFPSNARFWLLLSECYYLHFVEFLIGVYFFQLASESEISSP